jgi:hypothetical protein
MDEDRLTPSLGRLIDAAKTAAAAAGPDEPPEPGAGRRGEGWAVLGVDGEAYPGGWLAAAVSAALSAGTRPEAAAFAVVGERADTLLPRGDWREGAQDVDPQLPVTVKYLGRWVLVTLGEIPAP